MVETDPGTVRLMCSTCVSGGAKFPPKHVKKSSWAGTLSKKKQLEEGMTFE